MCTPADLLINRRRAEHERPFLTSLDEAVTNPPRPPHKGPAYTLQQPWPVFMLAAEQF